MYDDEVTKVLTYSELEALKKECRDNGEVERDTLPAPAPKDDNP